MQTTPKPIPTKSPRKTKTAARFLLDWAAVIALALCFIAFTLIKGSRFMSFNNMINILRAMSITTVFAIAATVTMAPDGFDMSACTLASCSAYVFVSMYLWYGLPLFACVLITIAVTLVMYQLTMFLILVCKIPDMLHPFCLWYRFIFLLASLSSDNDPRWRCLSCRSKRSEIFLYRFNAQKPVIRARLKPGILLIWSCYRRAIPEIFLLRQLPSFCQLYVSLWVLCQKQIRVPWCGLRRPENSPDPFIRYPLPEQIAHTYHKYNRRFLFLCWHR